jgi:hypothetical protein
LEEAILNYAGCVVVISHDRWFLDRIATHILAFEGDGYVHWCEGNFQTYEEQREPHRFRYKRGGGVQPDVSLSVAIAKKLPDELVHLTRHHIKRLREHHRPTRFQSTHHCNSSFSFADLWKRL